MMLFGGYDKNKPKTVKMTQIITPHQALIAPQQFDTNILTGQVADSTKAMYSRDFAAYLDFAGSFVLATTPTTLAQWRTHLAEETEMSPHTINRMLSAVRALMKAAAEQGYLSREVALRFETVKGVKVVAMKRNLKPHARTRITPEEMRQLCEAPDSKTLPGLMHRAFLLTLATSALRISEIVPLTLEQIDERVEAGQTKYVIRVIGKNESEEEDAPLGVEAHHAILKWLMARPIDSPWIFTGFTGRGGRGPRTNYIREDSARELVYRYAKVCNLAHIKPHDFRRFVGTRLAKDNPRQAQKALRHKLIETTMKHYVLDELELGLTDGLF